MIVVWSAALERAGKCSGLSSPYLQSIAGSTMRELGHKPGEVWIDPTKVRKNPIRTCRLCGAKEKRRKQNGRTNFLIHEAVCKACKGFDRPQSGVTRPVTGRR